MRDDFVEQEDRRKSGHVFDQRGMRENEPDQQGFLLAGRTIRRRQAFAGVRDHEIGQMWAVERAACGGVARVWWVSAESTA